MESKGLRVNVTKTKVMSQVVVVLEISPERGKFLCSVCGKGCLCAIQFFLVVLYKYKVHKKCSGITDSLRDDNQFICKKCKTMKMDENSNVEKVYLDGKAIEVAQKFCYIDDTIGAKGGDGASVIARIRSE